jgi:serine/threonine protein kinase
LGNKLGEGSNGVVYKCKHRETKQEFAVKSFRIEDEHLPMLRSTFLAMHQLSHVGIIKYKALYIDNQKMVGWLVMELADFPSLDEAKPKTEEDIKHAMYQIMEALAYLHRHGIAHRDIKPANIHYDPSARTVKLIDFGISKHFGHNGALADMWTMTGTLCYKAPEMLACGYKQKVDIWAAGILLYELIAGRTPFES